MNKVQLERQMGYQVLQLQGLKPNKEVSAIQKNSNKKQEIFGNKLQSIWISQIKGIHRGHIMQ